MIIELKNGMTKALINTKGAEIISFKGDDGRERIWQADPEIWGRHAPVLFPVCCAVKNNSVVIDGKAYPMTKHGFVRDWEFQISQEAHSGNKVDLVMTPTEESKKMFPFEYELHVIFEVLENSFSCSFAVKNKSDRMMPFCVGGHPAFICPFEDEDDFSDMEIVFPNKESGVVALLSSQGEITGREELSELNGKDRLTLNHTFFDERDTLIFPELESRSVRLLNKKSGSGIQFDFPSMPVLAVWSKPNANASYVCLEPWHGLPAGIDESAVLEDKPFAVKLDAGQTFDCGYAVKII